MLDLLNAFDFVLFVIVWCGLGAAPFYSYNSENFANPNPRMRDALFVGLLFALWFGPIAAVVIGLFALDRKMGR